MKIKGIVFDLDGTLVHTAAEYRYLVVGKTLAELGTSAASSAIDHFWYETHRDKVIEEEFQINPQQFWPIYRQNDKIELRAQHARTYQDVSATLKTLRASGLKLGILTGCPQHIFDMEIALVNPNYFQSMILARNEIKKPSPIGLLKCLEELQVSVQEALFVGNGEEDILTARNAGVTDVLIDRAEYPCKTKATHTIDDLKQLRFLV